MTFLIRKPFIFIIIGILCVVLVIHFSGVLKPKPPVVISPSLASPTISMNKNTTLTVVIENQGTRQYSVEYRIVGTFNSSQLLFYDKISGALLSSSWTGKNYTMIYPLTWNLNTGERRDVSVYVKGLDPKIDSATYTIFLEVWVDKAFSERKSIQLKVTRT